VTGAAVFFDRDGVLNEVVWRDGKPASPRHLSEFVVAEHAKDLLTGLKSKGCQIFVVTNQPDVSRGKMSQRSLEEMHNWLTTALPVDAIAVCTHDNDDNCQCRKPKPGLVNSLAEHFDLDLVSAWLIGDQDRDVVCARTAGVKSILLARSYNSGTGADFVVSTLSEAVDIINRHIDLSPGVCIL